ncbi:MAG: SDR family oxidoreductase [bacterium]|nr:SDR family oxidoreductase [bacterium]
MGLLGGTVALITGSSGIAAATARRMSERDTSVCVVGIDPGEVAALVGELGEAALGHVADLRSIEETDAAFAACTERFGSPDVVVAVAGGSGRRFGDGAIDTMTDEAWQDTLSLNATPVMTTTRAAVSAMKTRGGSIIIVSSVLASSPAPPRFETHAYAAAKGAALALVTSLAASYAGHGIRVNAVLPAATNTPMAARAADDSEIQDYLARKQPLTGGMIEADDVAALITFLASDDARAITGQLIAVDGGWSVSQAT